MREEVIYGDRVLRRDYVCLDRFKFIVIGLLNLHRPHCIDQVAILISDLVVLVRIVTVVALGGVASDLGMSMKMLRMMGTIRFRIRSNRYSASVRVVDARTAVKSEVPGRCVLFIVYSGSEFARRPCSVSRSM